MKNSHIFLSAISQKGDINVGYLVLLRSGQICAGVIVAMVCGSIMEFWFGETVVTVGGITTTTRHAFNILALGQGIGLVLAAYGGALLTGVATFLWGDSKTPTPALTQTTTQTTVATVPAAT